MRTKRAQQRQQAQRERRDRRRLRHKTPMQIIGRMARGMRRRNEAFILPTPHGGVRYPLVVFDVARNIGLDSWNGE